MYVCILLYSKCWLLVTWWVSWALSVAPACGASPEAEAGSFWPRPPGPDRSRLTWSRGRLQLCQPGTLETGGAYGRAEELGIGVVASRQCCIWPRPWLLGRPVLLSSHSALHFGIFLSAARWAEAGTLRSQQLPRTCAVWTCLQTARSGHYFSSILVAFHNQGFNCISVFDSRSKILGEVEGFFFWNSLQPTLP